MLKTLPQKTKPKDLEPYSGKWVAFVNEKVINSAPSLEKLMSKVKKGRLKQEPSVMLVPRQDEGPYVLVI